MSVCQSEARFGDARSKECHKLTNAKQQPMLTPHGPPAPTPSKLIVPACPSSSGIVCWIDVVEGARPGAVELHDRSSSAEAKCAIPGAGATKLPAGNNVALVGSAVSPMPNRNVPAITVMTYGLGWVIQPQREHLVLARIAIEDNCLRPGRDRRRCRCPLDLLR